ncbi:hypothetical protein PGTUg99_026511 [Puccinia graminis f. sp. tritici]|uniref:Hydrophobin n=1 Tax=Puccinia graminis f. sp. tritici TaxID=56615 RepID=A0A5B0Q3S1_PUCGR|nr:hypothetical protein PGTUg99_026511 [Puccinia graminis f. sp. tritici]
MQIFKAAILLVSSIGFKVALGCDIGFEKGCAFKPAYGNAYSIVTPLSQATCNLQEKFEVCCPAGILQYDEFDFIVVSYILDRNSQEKGFGSQEMQNRRIG